jgi:hypothetical protein
MSARISSAVAPLDGGASSPQISASCEGAVSAQHISFDET